MKITQQLQTDVLVIGAGGAGLRAALAAAEAGSEVLLINKGPVGKSGVTLTAAGGMQAPLHPTDSPEHYFGDTVRCGYGLGDQNLARVLAEGAGARVADLERYGARFVRGSDGDYAFGQFPGQSKPRNLAIKGGGIGLVGALANACKRHERITIIEDFFVTGLVKGRDTDPAIAGAVGLNLKRGDLTLIRARAVVMATGGCQWLWEVNDCPTDATGDGLVHAYRSGAAMVDMEMVLFYPSVIIWPPSLKGAFVHYEFLNTNVLDGNIYDKDGCAVLTKPLPVRDQAMRQMAEAINNGRGGSHGGLLWYVGDSPKGAAAVQKALDTLQYNYIKAHGVDPATAKIEVAPGAHYLMGGIYINEECRTSVQGLFATPECAGNFDGANRLAGSGLTATQVFGAQAGLYAHNWAKDNGGAEVDAAALDGEIWRVANRIATGDDKEIKVTLLRNRLRAAMQQYAGVVRSAEGLSQLAAIVREIEDELTQEKVPGMNCYNQQLVDLLQMENMCEVAAMVAGCAQLRTESRGHHFRADFPEQDDVNWLKHTMVAKGKDGPIFGSKPVIRI